MLPMYNRLIQTLSICVILTVKFSDEITLLPTIVNVVEEQSVNITCTIDDSTDHTAIFDINNNQSAIIPESCQGEGLIVTHSTKYGYYCPSNISVVVSLKSVQRTSHLITITCTTQVNGTVKSSNNVTVYVFVPITNVTLHQTSTIPKTYEIRETVLKCITSPGYPTPTIHWYKNGSRLLPSQTNIKINDTITDTYPMTTKSALRIYPGRDDNSSRFYCSANNTEKQWLYSDNVTLLVYYGPDKPTLSMGTYTVQDTVNIISGHSLKIQCNSKGYPTSHYSWLTPNSLLVEGNTLSVPNVTYPDSNGTYKCRVNVSMELSTGTENGANETSVHVTVLYPPKTPQFLYNGTTSIPNRYMRTVSGDTFIVRCISDSVPKPTYTWTGLENNPNITNGNNLPDLKIKSIQNDMILICTVVNVMEETHGTKLNISTHSTLNISVLYPPQKPKFNLTNMAGNVLQHKNKIDVIEGDTVVIICYAHSRPEPDRYFWSSRPSVNNATMELTSVTRSQTGTYLCTAKNTMRRTFGDQISGTNENELEINVQYQPTTPLFTYNNVTGTIINNGIVQVIRGKSLLIVCHSTGNPVVTDYKWQSSDTNSQVLNIDNVTRDEKLVCEATNVMIDSFGNRKIGSSAGTLSIDVLYPPEVIQLSVNHGLTIINNNSVHVVEGRNVTLSCNATSNPPPSTYTWTRLSTTLHESLTGEYNIVRIKRKQTGQYNCTVTNTMMPSFEKEENGTSSKLINIDVLYPTSIENFEVNGHPTVNITVNETDQLIFVCTVDGKPASNVSIFHKGTMIKQQIVTTSISHTMTNVSCLQHGLYTCMANNPYTSTAPMKNTTVFVLCSPRPKPKSNMESVFASKLYTDATISFEVFAYPVPRPTGFVWRRELDNVSTWIKLRDNGRTQISTLDFQSNLILKNVTRSSFGKYELEVTNKVGTYTHQFIFKAEDVPDTPIDFRYVSELTTESTILLTWKPGFNGGLPQTFVLCYREIDANNIWLEKPLPDTGERTMNITLTTLKSGTIYEIYIIATNEIGNSSLADILKVQTLAVEIPPEPSSVLPIVFGTVGSAVVCFIVVALMLYIRRFRKSKQTGYYRDTRADGSRGVYENSLCETVFDHRHANKNEQEGKSSVYQNVSVAKFSSTSSVSCKPSTSRTNLVTKHKPSQKLYANVSGFSKDYTNAKQKSTSKHKKSEKSDKKKPAPRAKILLEHDEDEIPAGNQNNEFVYGNVGRRIERVQVGELITYVTDKLYEPDYQEFKKGLQFPTTIAQKPENIKLNRFQGIYPYDHSRVTLTGDPNFFMNACYINGYSRNKAYIASLGPTSDTTHVYSTFWKMVWHEQSNIIVMLTNLREISGMKCQQYWPDVGLSIKYGDVTVTCQKIQAFGEYTVRTFDVTKAEVVRKLTQLHFTAWPDKSVPDDVTSLLEFRQRIKAAFSVRAGPIIVHCSAGIGRTGTLIALDMLIDEGKTECSVNASACVKRLREQRVNMVQTQEQYAYIHKALVYALVFESEVIYTETFQEYLESTSDTFFDNMFEQIRPNVSCHDEDKARWNNEQYKNINRPDADIPGDKHSVKLYLNKTSEDVDYINAVYVNSFKKKNHFISAQTPRTSSVEDFLCLIYQEDCLCIVTLDESEIHGTVLANKDVGVYLPPDNNNLSIGNFKISCTRLETNPQYIVRRLKIENFGKFDAGNKISYHFQYTQWDSDNRAPNDPSEFAQFVRNVDQYVNELGDDEVHVLVHCLDASDRSGLFCCIASMIEKIECEGQVNIGNTIRQIRSRRMTVIQNMEQLRFCHQAVNAYINMKTAQ